MKSQKLSLALLGALALGVGQTAQAYKFYNDLNEPVDVFVMNEPGRWGSLQERLKNMGIAFKLNDKAREYAQKDGRAAQDPRGQLLLKSSEYASKFSGQVNDLIIMERTMARHNIPAGGDAAWNQNHKQLKDYEDLAFSIVGKKSGTHYGVYVVSKRAAIKLVNNDGTISVEQCLEGSDGKWNDCSYINEPKTSDGGTAYFVKEVSAKDRYINECIAKSGVRGAGFADILNPNSDYGKAAAACRAEYKAKEQKLAECIAKKAKASGNNNIISRIKHSAECAQELQGK